MKEVIRPFIGIGEYKLLSSQETIIEILEKNCVGHSIDVWDNEECDPPAKWTIINADNHLNFFFAKDKLFKVYINGQGDYCLENGIFVGMPMREALRIDPTLEFDDWNED